jgi:hypothetical protein
LKPKKRAERCDQDRQRDHGGDEKGRDLKFHDHHAVQRAQKQNGGHADRHLEQAEA